MKLFTASCFIFCFFAYNAAKAQPGFNLVDDLGYPANHMLKMIVHNDTIVGYGMALNDTIDFQRGLLLTKYDTSGILIQHNLILDSLGDLLGISNIWGGIVPSAEGGYAMTAAPFYRNSAMLIKVDNDLEVEFIKEYVDTSLASNFNYKILAIDDGYILYGSVQNQELVDRPFIRRVDFEGNEIWNNFYGDSEYWGNINHLVQLNDSVLVAGNVHLTTSNLFGPSRTSLYFVHMNGTLLDEWHTGPDPSIGYLRKLMLLDDGGYLVYGLAIIDKINSSYIVQPAVSKLDQNLSVKWTKKYGRISTLSAQITFRSIEPTIDGNFIAAGKSGIEMGSDPTLSSGWLMKFSPEGDSIWSRYDLAPFTPSHFNVHYFGGVGVLSSGSIVAGGYAYEGPDRYNWLVKVTNDGCLDTIHCGLVAPTFANEELKKNRPLVYPNPAASEFHVELEHPVLNGEIQLFDLNGKLVHRQRTNNQEKIDVHVSELPAGIYFLEMRMDGSVLWREKVMVLR